MPHQGQPHKTTCRWTPRDAPHPPRSNSHNVEYALGVVLISVSFFHAVCLDSPMTSVSRFTCAVQAEEAAHRAQRGADDAADCGFDHENIFRTDARTDLWHDARSFRGNRMLQAISHVYVRIRELT